MMNKLYFYCLALFVAPTFSAFGQTQPSQDENGYYLIESAEHLVRYGRWHYRIHRQRCERL